METISCAVGVRFKSGDKICFYLEPEDIKLQLNDLVVVKGEHGAEVARVVLAPGQMAGIPLDENVQPILRRATREDLGRKMVCEEEALLKCKEYVGKLRLSMKPLFALSSIDGAYIVVYFASPHKVDFRELAHCINSDLRTRVELRRVGAREGARMLGGMGRCGLTICCSSFLGELSPPTTKVIKEAGLNPSKFCGICGHILCCLAYENLKGDYISKE